MRSLTSKAFEFQVDHRRMPPCVRRRRWTDRERGGVVVVMGRRRPGQSMVYLRHCGMRAKFMHGLLIMSVSPV